MVGDLIPECHPLATFPPRVVDAASRASRGQRLLRARLVGKEVVCIRVWRSSRMVMTQMLDAVFGCPRHPLSRLVGMLIAQGNIRQETWAVRRASPQSGEHVLWLAMGRWLVPLLDDLHRAPTLLGTVAPHQ